MLETSWSSPEVKKCSSNDKQNSRRAYISESASTSQPYGPTINQNGPNPLSTLGAITQSDMSRSLSLINVDGKNPWIVDLRATDHLTDSYENFVSYILCASNEKIRIANGSLAPTAEKL